MENRYLFEFCFRHPLLLGSRNNLAKTREPIKVNVNYHVRFYSFSQCEYRAPYAVLRHSVSYRYMVVFGKIEQISAIFSAGKKFSAI